jgi:hypothetical protein
MELNRRGFLGLLGAALVGATLDPERLLWVPGQKVISIPPPRWNRIYSSSEAISAQMEFIRPQNEWLNYLEKMTIEHYSAQVFEMRSKPLLIYAPADGLAEAGGTATVGGTGPRRGAISVALSLARSSGRAFTRVPQ